MSGPYVGYIAAAYGTTGLVVAWLILSAWLRGRARARRLAELGDG